MNAVPPLLRRMMLVLVIALAVLASFGVRWRSQRGGYGTQIAFAVARTICPTEARFTDGVSVAAGARAIDRAALLRAGDLIMRSSRCRLMYWRSAHRP